jgi:hypothetical protein
MRKVAISPGFASIFLAFGRFLFAPLFFTERADGATAFCSRHASSPPPSPLPCPDESRVWVRSVFLLWRRADKLI